MESISNLRLFISVFFLTFLLTETLVYQFPKPVTWMLLAWSTHNRLAKSVAFVGSGFWGQLPEFWNSALTLTVWLWKSYFTSVSLSFSINRMDVQSYLCLSMLCKLLWYNPNKVLNAVQACFKTQQKLAMVITLIISDDPWVFLNHHSRKVTKLHILRTSISLPYADRFALGLN